MTEALQVCFYHCEGRNAINADRNVAKTIRKKKNHENNISDKSVKIILVLGWLAAWLSG